MGKALGQPVSNLLGGKVNEKLRSYTYLYPAELPEGEIAIGTSTATQIWLRNGPSIT